MQQTNWFQLCVDRWQKPSNATLVSLAQWFVALLLCCLNSRLNTEPAFRHGLLAYGSFLSVSICFRFVSFVHRFWVLMMLQFGCDYSQLIAQNHSLPFSKEIYNKCHLLVSIWDTYTHLTHSCTVIQNKTKQNKNVAFQLDLQSPELMILAIHISMNDHWKVRYGLLHDTNLWMAWIE